MTLGSNQIWGKQRGYFYSDLHVDKVRMQRIKITDAPYKTITEIVDYSGTAPGTVKIKTSAAHGLSTSDYITVYGTTSYDATYQITKIDADEFYVTATYVADETAGYLYSVYATGGMSYDILANYDFAANNADVILDADASYQYVYDKANAKIMFLTANTSAEASANAGIAPFTIYGTIIGKN